MLWGGNIFREWRGFPRDSWAFKLKRRSVGMHEDVQLRKESGRGEREKGRRDGTGSPCERSQESLRRAAPGPVVFGLQFVIDQERSPTLLSSVCVGVCQWTESVSASACTGGGGWGVDRALLLPSPGWQPSVWWSVAAITTGRESRGTVTWVGQGKTGTVKHPAWD